jgi:putative oxidoreductase
MIDAGLLVIRLVFGLVMAAHGAQKLFGWFGGYGLQAVAGMFDSPGFRPGSVFATLAATAELAGGLLMATGLFGPVGPAVVVSVMIVAAGSVHWANGLFATANGIEVPLLYGTAATALALSGPGRYALDAVAGLTPVWTPATELGVLAVAIIGGALNLALRRPAAIAAAA